MNQFMGWKLIHSEAVGLWNKKSKPFLTDGF
jgi:hypothetical protein